MFSQAQFKKLGAPGSKGEDYASCTRQEKPSPGPVAPVYRKRINVACLFRAKSGAAGVADAVQTAGGAALQPQPHGRTALSQHGGVEEPEAEDCLRKGSTPDGTGSLTEVPCVACNALA